MSNKGPYLGCQSVTKSGLKCQPWNKQTPHKHTLGTGSKHPVDDLAAKYGFCRHPGASSPVSFAVSFAGGVKGRAGRGRRKDDDDAKGIWCYTVYAGCRKKILGGLGEFVGEVSGDST